MKGHSSPDTALPVTDMTLSGIPAAAALGKKSTAAHAESKDNIRTRTAGSSFSNEADAPTLLLLGTMQRAGEGQPL